MIYNDHFFAIEDQVQRVVDQLLKSPSFQNYLINKIEMYQDQELAEIRQEFTEKKEAFDRIAEYGRHAPDYREKQRALRKVKRVLDLHPKVAEFRLSETHLQGILDEIILKIAASFSEDVIVDTGNPFFESKSSCGGGCHHG
ncbi:YlbF/YmcA family competence regulator [Enterococcus sp. LJL98]